MDGQITRFDADGLGDITLTDGRKVRFGRSACQGFDPILNARVVVAEMGPHPLGGERATRVVLAAGAQAELDKLQEAAGAARGTLYSDEQNAGSAFHLGTITFLLPAVLPPGREGVRAFFAGTGVEPEFSPNPSIALGGVHMQVFVSRTARLPEGQFDLRRVGGQMPPYASLVSISTGLANLSAAMRVVVGKTYPDPWGENGPIRHLTRLAVVLAQRSTAVVLHRANRVVPASRFLQLAGDPRDPNQRAFDAWIDVALDHERKVLASTGMAVAALPDVAAACNTVQIDDEFWRAYEAVMHACYLMTRENRELAAGERLRVPVAMPYGPSPLPVEPSDGTETTWEVHHDESGHLLLKVAALGKPFAQAWREGNIGFRAYRELFVGRLRASGLRDVASVDYHQTAPGVPPHSVYVFQRSDGDFLLITAGIGRVRQPNGATEADTANIEFMIRLSRHHPAIAHGLSLFGRLLHIRGPQAPPFGPEHKISLGEPIAGWSKFAFGWGGRFSLGDGPPLALFSPIPVTDDEYASLNASTSPQWIAANAALPAVRDRWLKTVQA